MSTRSKAAKLSPRAELLLGVVKENSNLDGYVWIPRVWGPKSVFGEFQNPPYGLTIGGAGDAAILKSLAARGLVKFSDLAQYACSITTAGIAEYDRILKRRQLMQEKTDGT